MHGHVNVKFKVVTFKLRPILARGENHLCVLERRLDVLLISGHVLERKMFAPVEVVRLHSCAQSTFLLTAVSGYLDTVRNLNFR